MSEDLRRPRPVADPSLSPRRRKEALAAYARLRHPGPDGSEPPHRSGSRPSPAVLAFASCALFVLAMILGGWYLATAVAGAAVFATALALTVRGGTHPLVRAAGALLGAVSLLTVPVWYLTQTAAELSLALLAGLLVLVVADAATRARGDGLRAHLVAPDDIAEADHALLCEVQHTIDRVRAHARELGEGPDPARALIVLRDEEWRIADVLARQRTMRREHQRRWQRAETDRVRRALRAQREYLDLVDAAVRRRVDSVRGCGHAFDRALSAHREWVQCQEVRDTTPDYAVHFVDAADAIADAGHVPDLVDGAEAAARAREEQLREFLDHPRFDNP